MSRFVWPQAFQLFSRGLTDAAPESVRGALARLREFDTSAPAFGQHGAPVALRWCTLPALGFPRQPFQVFRRSGRFPLRGISGDIQITGPAVIEWGRVATFHVTFQAQPAAGSSLTIQALDRTLRPIPGQTIAVAASTRCRFRAPGVAALRVTGNGLISSLQGANANECANLSDWELIEVVGLPFDRAEIAAPHYDPDPQGFAPASRFGLEAARNRLELATILHLPLPPTGVATIPTPPWPPPDVAEYLRFLRDQPEAVLRMIEKCLHSTNDADPNNLQAAFLFTQSGDGIRQADLPGAPSGDPAEFSIPVVGATMLSVSAEPYAATSLGYGTIDFPPPLTPDRPDAVEPAVSFRTDFDYMVTSAYVFIEGFKVELAALAQGRPDPEPAAALAASRLRRNRPPSLDAPETEAVQLRWNYSLLPQGYAVALSRNAGESGLLNSARPFPQGFELFTPPREESIGGGPPEGNVTFTDPVSEVPLSGTTNTEYLVAGGDVFGRWSGWTRTTYVAQAPPIQTPGLHSVQAALDPSTAVGRKVTGDLTIEFSWDWTDRRARLVEFHGRFYSPTATPPAFAAGLQLDSTAAAGGAVVVTFDAARNPSISSGHDADVEILTPVPADETRRYRLVVHQFKVDFSAQPQRDYALFARAEESVRPAGQKSDAAGPRTAKIFDPLPPDVPEITADLQWTALPDAANRARGVLTWPSDPHALGYVVWESTEAALRHAIDPTIPAPAPEVTAMDRALALTGLLTDGEARVRSSIAFARVNTNPLQTNKVEIELPGGASTLYAYRVSSLSAANQESSRSEAVAWFAVPRRIKPGQPGLRVRAVPGGIELTAIASPGTPPRGYRVLRVRNSALLAESGMKGPPKIAPDDPGWQDLVINGAAARRIVDAVGESWQPYYYQVVALAQENLAAGEYAGESAPSTTIPAFLPPGGPPAFELLASAANADNRLVSFRSNLPAKPTDLGAATIELIEYARVPADGPLQRRPLLTIAALDVPIEPAPGGPASGATPPKITRLQNTPDGRTEFSLQYPASVTRAVLILRDPLLRITETTLPS